MASYLEEVNMFDKFVENAKLKDKNAMEEIIRRLQPLIISSIRKYYYNIKEYDAVIRDLHSFPTRRSSDL